MNQHAVIRPLYTIGTVARLTGISTHSLRAWDRRYGLSASVRDDSGRRVYSQTDLDHLMLVKELVDSGIKIGDIARLPSDTLRLMSQDAKSGANDRRVMVIGRYACDLIDKHQNRFRGYQCELFYRGDHVHDFDDIKFKLKPWLLVLDFESLSLDLMISLRNLIEKIKPNKTLLMYRYGSEDMLEKIQSDTHVVELFQGAVSIDSLLLQFDRFNAPLIQNDEGQALTTAPNRFFDDDKLDQLVDLYERSDCSCPSHMSELIRALSSFEEYCLQCESSNAEEAKLHSSIYSHTAKARHLMECAVQVLIDTEQEKQLK